MTCDQEVLGSNPVSAGHFFSSLTYSIFHQRLPKQVPLGGAILQFFFHQRCLALKLSTNQA